MTEIERHQIREDERDVEILDSTSDNVYIRHPDGSTDNIPMSKRNRLMYIHNLYSFFMGNEIITVKQEDGSTVNIVPQDEGAYMLKFPRSSVRVPAKDSYRLIDVLVELYEENNEVRLSKFHDDLIRGRVRKDIVSEIAGMEPFVTLIEENEIDITEDGWVFNDDLTLTWDSQFHKEDDTYSPDGTIMNPDSAQEAIKVDPGITEPVTVELNGNPVKLSRKEMNFFSSVAWATQNL